MLAENNVRTAFFDAAEVAAVCACLPAVVARIVEFAYITGWRLREVLTLEWRNVDFDGGVVVLDAAKSKNGEGRVFHLTRNLESLLREQRRYTDETCVQDGLLQTAVVFHRSGRPVRDFRGVWSRACRDAGCPGRLFHDLRSAVRNLVRAGAPERVAMRLTGPKTRSVFERYNIGSNADLADAARRLDAWRAGETHEKS
jgi:integrase